MKLEFIFKGEKTTRIIPLPDELIVNMDFNNKEYPEKLYLKYNDSFYLYLNLLSLDYWNIG